MSEVFLGINKAGQLYVDATLDASITFSFVYHYTYSLLHTTINIETLYKSGKTNFNITLLLIRQPRQ